MRTRPIALQQPFLVLLCSLALAALISPLRAQQAIPPAEELERSGAIIGQILIDPQNIFDLNDPKEDKKLFRLANKLHYKTRSDVIRRQLLFHPGDMFSQRALDESERILRSQRYLYD
ncbi:MAG TPA: hypothetical protein VFS24_02660, partial [Steroidobacteraceae bacterium]|nr:hypothetical protein [Steroidobacteraceae bacterium]